MKSRLVYLFYKYLDGLASASEHRELMELASRTEKRQELEELLKETWETREADLPFLNDNEKQAILADIFRKSDAPLIIDHKPVAKIKWMKLLAAACLLLAISFSAWYLLKGNQNRLQDSSTPPALVQDVKAPEENKASITLSNGQKIYLDSAGNGSLRREGNVEVVVKGGQVTYLGNSTETLYNTLYNPRGSKVVNLTLSDGTRVWLNSESSIRYPVSFNNNAERQVEITGESYFEVATRYKQKSNQRIPFIVKHGSMEVQVLGTHFNVNTYADDGVLKVTLLEGLVKVSSDADKAMLHPGEQARVDGHINVQDHADLEAVMAWKNGLFSFNKTGLREVIQMLARWYNVEVLYEGVPQQREFWGKIRRSSNLSEVLLILEKSDIHCRIEGNKLIVSR
ncbi:MAG TPA: FecR domain-containing protein [Chitinophagaceae bacterium]|nr:FecR domain-containing protein [Chitinophagaceae bacterium]